MPTARTRKPAASSTALPGTGRKQAPGKRPVTRAKSGLTEIGDEAMRKALLAELRRQAWNLTGTADALRMTGPSNVLRAIKALDLTAEYDAAKAAGKISPGSRTS